MKKNLTIALMCVIVLTLLGCPHANDGENGNTGGGEKVYVKPADETIFVDDGNAVPMQIIGIKGGTFTMGQTDPNIGGNGFTNDEHPLREVTINSFMLGSTEVTEAQWEAVMGIWPGTDPAKDSYSSSAEHPARNISWYDAIRFCNKLSKSEGLDEVYYVGDEYSEMATNKVTDANATFAESSVKMDITKNGYRLPTEAEWEYAAGGATATPTVYAGTGDVNSLKNFAVYDVSNPSAVKEGRRPVSSAYDLYDMSGNMWEWCWDWYDTNYYGVGITNNPTGPAASPISFRVMRGGCWEDKSSSSLRVADRGLSDPTDRHYITSFRVARNASN